MRGRSMGLVFVLSQQQQQQQQRTTKVLFATSDQIMSTTQKKCGKCEKTVYPTEEIQCLDKFWHKGCLKCSVCGLTLNVKNVKGYDRTPYCQAHYPQPKPTAVTDNPEMQRMRFLTDIQSTAKYHEDFNRSKGKFTAVTDDSSMVRAKEQQKIVSQAEYTGKRKDSTSQLLSSVSCVTPAAPAPIGRVADYDPINDHHGSLTHGYEPTAKGLQGMKFQATESEASTPSAAPPVQQLKVRALYSYTAAELDELSFTEGDILVECEEIDSGWMIGRHPLTNRQGLLPSNYVEIVR